MIPLLVAVLSVTPQAVTTVTRANATSVTYESVPAEVVRISVHAWQDAASPSRVGGDVMRQGSAVTIRATPDHRTLVRLERADGAYLIDGPFWWPLRDAERPLDRRWRRTLAAAAPEPIAGATEFEWLSAGGEGTGEWPRCFQAGARSMSCWGAPVGDPGVLLCRAGGRVWWTVVSRGSTANLRSSRWGRLLVVTDSTGGPDGLRVKFARPVSSASQRGPGVRLDTAIVAGGQSTPLGASAAWLSGDDVPAGAWVEVRTMRAGPAYLSLQDVAEGSSSFALTMRLDETRALDGLVVGARAVPASGALVTVFRLIDPPRPLGDRAKDRPRRVLAAEAVADASGAFHVDGLGDADYEILGWHPQLGRASVSLPQTRGSLTVRLEAPGIVRGRVLAGGKPLGGVDVLSLPSPDAFKAADDLVDLKGGDTRTGADGRFAVMAAASGGGELRVGGGTWPVRRVPLPRQPAPLLDLGDIDLGSSIEISIVLDQESPCDVRATGPIGQSGLQVVTAARTGPGLFRMMLPEPGLWAFGLLCSGEDHPIVPALVQLGAANTGKELRFSVR